MESTLALKLDDLRAKVGTFAGWGRGTVFGDPAWDSRKTSMIEDAVQSGLRRFYFPEPLQNEVNSHQWSFLRPVAQRTLPNTMNTVRLPDDYGGPEGPVTLISTSQQTQPWRVEWRNEGQIREMYAINPTMVGPPMFVSEQVLRGTSINDGQRKQLYFFPAADQDYPIQFAYYLNPNYLNGTTPYAYGGVQHTETILESCLSAFEERWDDTSSVHREAFKVRLAASVAMDRRNKTESLGYNGDRSDSIRYQRGDMHYFAPAATYNGNPFQ